VSCHRREFPAGAGKGLAEGHGGDCFVVYASGNIVALRHDTPSAAIPVASVLPRPPDRCRVFAVEDHCQGGAPAAKRGRTTLTMIFARRNDARRGEDGLGACISPIGKMLSMRRQLRWA
jgi:hypothetical protein